MEVTFALIGRDFNIMNIPVIYFSIFKKSIKIANLCLTKPEDFTHKLIFRPTYMTYRRTSSDWYLIHFGGKLVDVLLPVSKFVINMITVDQVPL